LPALKREGIVWQRRYAVHILSAVPDFAQSADGVDVYVKMAGVMTVGAAILWFV
jgi:hypothetical protein